MTFLQLQIPADANRKHSPEKNIRTHFICRMFFHCHLFLFDLDAEDIQLGLVNDVR